MENCITIFNEDGSYTSFNSMNELIDSDFDNVALYVDQVRVCKLEQKKKELESTIDSAFETFVKAYAEWLDTDDEIQKINSCQ